MRTIGKYVGPGRTIEGNLTITFEVEDDYKALENLKGYAGAELVIETKKYHEKRSLSANGYFWALVGKIAVALGSDKETIYLWLIKYYGVFFDVRVIPEALQMLKDSYRLAEAWDEFPGDDGMVEVRCYVGSSHYDKAQMGYLIDKTVEQAQALNIDTWTPDEVEALLSVWEAQK